MDTSNIIINQYSVKYRQLLHFLQQLIYGLVPFWNIPQNMALLKEKLKKRIIKGLSFKDDAMNWLKIKVFNTILLKMTQLACKNDAIMISCIYE